MFKKSASVLILTTFCIQPAFYSRSQSRSLHFTPGLQSVVYSLHFTVPGITMNRNSE